MNNITEPSGFHVREQVTQEVIPKWPWFVFLFGAMGCLICSSLSHLLACHSRRFNIFFWRLDYAGISLMIDPIRIQLFVNCNNQQAVTQPEESNDAGLMGNEAN